MFQGSSCCGYGSKGTNAMGFDCLIIPGAQKTTAIGVFPSPNYICGSGKGLVNVAGGASTTICSKGSSSMTSQSWGGG